MRLPKTLQVQVFLLVSPDLAHLRHPSPNCRSAENPETPGRYLRWMSSVVATRLQGQQALQGQPLIPPQAKGGGGRVSGNPLSTAHLDGRPLLDIHGEVGVGYREAAYTFGIQPHQTECRVFLNITMGHFLGSLAPVYKASTCSLVLHLDSSPHLCPTS